MINRRQSLKLLLASGAGFSVSTSAQSPRHLRGSLLIGLSSPVLLAGDADSAYRDPAAIYHAGWFHLFFTLIRKEQDGQRYSYVASSKSRNLRDWTKPRTLTPADKRLDYSSPGNVMQHRPRVGHVSADVSAPSRRTLRHR